tara:strand:+ start:138 stop:1046 length:909 start_codon:yes stop_codon:yes gene_type:complete
MIGNEYIELARIMAERKKLEDAYAKAMAPDPSFVGPLNPQPKPSNQQPPMPQPSMPSRANEIQPVNVTAQKRPVPGLFEPVEVTAQKRPTFFPSRIGKAMARGGGFQMTEDQKKGIYTPEEEARFRADRNQGIGNLLMDLSNAFLGKDIQQGSMQRRQFQQQQDQIEKKKEQYNALMNDPNTPPETKQLLASLGWQGMDQVLLKQFELDNQPEKTSSLYREYIDAVKSGYQGTFIDYKDRYGLTMTEKLLQEASGVMPSTVENVSAPQGFKGSAQQWEEVKKANPDFSDQELITWFNQTYGG